MEDGGSSAAGRLARKEDTLPTRSSRPSAECLPDAWRLAAVAMYACSDTEPRLLCADSRAYSSMARRTPKWVRAAPLVNLLCLQGCFRPDVTIGVLEEGVPGAFADLFSARFAERNSNYANQREVRTLNYKITADSTCDLSPELLEQYGLGLTPLYVQLGEKTYRDGVDIFPDDIYAHVTNGGDLATTAAVNLADHVRLFSDLSRNTTFVIHICISSDFSCCYQNAGLAAAEYPNVYLVDSRNLSTGHGLVVLEAERCAREGMEPEETVSYCGCSPSRWTRASF